MTYKNPFPALKPASDLLFISQIEMFYMNECGKLQTNKLSDPCQCSLDRIPDLTNILLQLLWERTESGFLSISQTLPCSHSNLCAYDRIPRNTQRTDKFLLGL